MTDAEKRKLVEAVGECWHKRGGGYDGYCSKCGEIGPIQLDPLDPGDMEKIWVAFIKDKKKLKLFMNWLWNREIEYSLVSMSLRPGKATIWHLLANSLPLKYLPAPDLAAAMLEYFEEKEGEDA